MQKHAAHVLADKVRRQLVGIPGVMAVDAEHFNPHAGDDQGWSVIVSRPESKGGDVHIIGTDRGGYTTTTRTRPRVTLPLLIREVFLDVEPPVLDVRPDDDMAAELLRGASAALSDVRALLGGVADELQTRKDELPWCVVVLNRGVEKGPNLRVHGPYANAPEANRALEHIPEASMPLDSPAVLVQVCQLIAHAES